MRLAEALAQLPTRPELQQRLPALARDQGAVLIGAAIIFPTPAAAAYFRHELTVASAAAKVVP